MKFIGRYWVLLLWFAIALAVTMNDALFKWVGMLVYVPASAFGAAVVALIIRRIMHSSTTDEYIRSGEYDNDFDLLPARDRVWLTFIQWFVLFLACVFLAGRAMGGQLEQQFEKAEIRAAWAPRLDRVIFGILRDKQRYVEIQQMRTNGMPWFIVAGIHERESSRNFSMHLHEGSPLTHRTRYVPVGRIPQTPPPYTFEQSAEDALYVLKRSQSVDWKNREAALDAIEKYNGTGYRRFHPDVPTPYLWSGTTAYSRGKYVADGRFSAVAVDKQPGVAALWKRMEERGLL